MGKLKSWGVEPSDRDEKKKKKETALRLSPLNEMTFAFKTLRRVFLQDKMGVTASVHIDAIYLPCFSASTCKGMSHVPWLLSNLASVSHSTQTCGKPVAPIR